MQHKCQTHSFIIKVYTQLPNSKKTKRTICNIFVKTSYHTDTHWMVMKWFPVHERVKYFSLLYTNIFVWAYRASCKAVGGAYSIRWTLDTHMHLMLMIKRLFHAHFLVLEIPLLWTKTQSTSGNIILCHCFLLSIKIPHLFGMEKYWIFWNSLWYIDIVHCFHYKLFSHMIYTYH